MTHFRLGFSLLNHPAMGDPLVMEISSLAICKVNTTNSQNMPKSHMILKHLEDPISRQIQSKWRLKPSNRLKFDIQTKGFDIFDRQK